MFKKNETAYIIENGAYVSPVTVLQYHSGFCIIKLKSATIRIRETRLFHTEEEATLHVPHPIKQPYRKNQYDYMRELY